MEKEENKNWNEYFYPNTNTFINKFDIKDDKELYIKETEVSFNRLVELIENPVVGEFNTNHLAYLHWYLFQDLYPWAGKFRNVNISKNHSNFTNYTRIRETLDYELNLMNEDVKEIHNKDTLANFLAEYYVILLNIHPFRDGNGRTIREFLREFTLVKTQDLGFGEYELDWSLVDSKTINESIKNSSMFRGPIEIELNKALVKVNNIIK